MRRRIATLAVVLVCGGALVALGACGLDEGGDEAVGADASIPPAADARSPGMPPGDANGSTDAGALPPVDATTVPEVGGDEPDAPIGPDDAAMPPPPVDASDASSVPPGFDAAGCMFCNGKCVTSCAGCDAGQALCAPTQTCGDCTGCAEDGGDSLPIQCFECPSATRQNPVGTCQPNSGSGYCLNGNTPSGFGHCECADAACPGSTEVCMSLNVGINVCVTCGENTQIVGSSTDNLACQGGGKCHANDQVPDCK